MPSFVILREMLVASELATSGSVIKKALRILPSSSGLSHRSFCSCVPYLANTSILPVSGAAQFVASDATPLLPRYSAINPYSRFEKPAPSLKWFFGRNMFHSPNSFARFLRSSRTGGWALKRVSMLAPTPTCCWKTVSAGMHSSSTNFSIYLPISIDKRYVRGSRAMHTISNTSFARSLTNGRAMMGIFSLAFGTFPLTPVSRFLISYGTDIFTDE